MRNFEQFKNWRLCVAMLRMAEYRQSSYDNTSFLHNNSKVIRYYISMSLWIGDNTNKDLTEQLNEIMGHGKK